jgi:hypothetical protein
MSYDKSQLPLGTRKYLCKTVLYYRLPWAGMHYVKWSGNGKDIYVLNPISQKLLESVHSPGIDKKAIVFEDTTKYCVKHKHKRIVHYRDTRYPRLDRLIEGHF